MLMPSKVRLSAIAAVLLASCGDAEVPGQASAVRDSAGVRIVESAAPVWDDAVAWQLSETPVLEIRGDGDNADEMPLDPASVFRHGENLIVADGLFALANRLLVYDTNGVFIRAIGRAGEGPCEFGQLWWAQPYRGDSIAAYDYSAHDVSIFTPDLTCARTLALPRWSPPTERGTYGFSAGADGAFDDGSFLTQPFGYLDVRSGPGPVWYRHAFLRVPPEGERFDSLGLFEITQQYWSTSQEEYPFGASADRAVAGEAFYFGRGDTFEIRRYRSDGTLEMIVRRAFEPPPVTADDREQYIGQYVEMMRNAGRDHGGDDAAERTRVRLQGVNFAPTKPAFSDILVDDEGNLWVQEYRTHLALDAAGELPPVHWSVFDRDGIWLGDVAVPGRFTPKTIANDEVLGASKDETGITHVQVYALTR